MVLLLFSVLVVPAGVASAVPALCWGGCAGCRGGGVGVGLLDEDWGGAAVGGGGGGICLPVVAV